MSLTFDTLRQANIARSKPDGSDWSPAQWMQAVFEAKFVEGKDK